MQFFLFFKRFFLPAMLIIYFLDVRANDILNQISQNDNDKHRLKLLFEYLFKSHEPFAYTLFGDKPMSFSFVVKPEPSAESTLNFIRIDEYALFLLKENNLPSVFYAQAWDVWEKNNYSLKLKNFLFLKRKLGNSPAIFLINKEAFHKTVNAHIKLFKNLLGKDIDSEKILNQIEQENSDICEILHQHDCLLGILLGFGKHNSILFEKRENLEKKLNCLNFVQSYQEMQSVKNQIDKLWDILKLRNDYYTSDLAMRNSIAFVADRDHPESKILEAKYKEQEVKISGIYSKDDWFEQTLLRLISYY
jgi:hypothetical protein